MKYKLKEHVTDEMLVTVGFEYGTIANTWLNRKQVNLVWISIPTKYNTIYKVRELYGEQECGSMGVCDVNDLTPYIQDLIDLNYVEVSK